MGVRPSADDIERMDRSRVLDYFGPYVGSILLPIQAAHLNAVCPIVSGLYTAPPICIPSCCLLLSIYTV